MNALATEILDAATNADLTDRQARLRARAAALGILRSTPSAPVTVAARRRALGSMRGIGPVLDRLLAEERDRV